MRLVMWSVLAAGCMETGLEAFNDPGFSVSSCQRNHHEQECEYSLHEKTSATAAHIEQTQATHADLNVPITL